MGCPESKSRGQACTMAKGNLYCILALASVVHDGTAFFFYAMRCDARV